MKVADLYTLFEEIQKDIKDLKDIYARIPKDREYSNQILQSIQQEIEKLEAKKNLILNMEISLPNSTLIEKEHGPQEIKNFDMPKEISKTETTTQVKPPLIKKHTRRY